MSDKDRFSDKTFYPSTRQAKQNERLILPKKQIDTPDQLRKVRNSTGLFSEEKNRSLSFHEQLDAKKDEDRKKRQRENTRRMRRKQRKHDEEIKRKWNENEEKIEKLQKVADDLSKELRRMNSCPRVGGSEFQVQDSNLDNEGDRPSWFGQPF